MGKAASSIRGAGASIIENSSSVKTGGETKVVAQKWSNNVHSLSSDVKNQVRTICIK